MPDKLYILVNIQHVSLNFNHFKLIYLYMGNFYFICMQLTLQGLTLIIYKCISDYTLDLQSNGRISYVCIQHVIPEV